MNEHVEKREATINPEILPEKLSVIIKDEDGNLYESTKDNLRQKGYIIKELDLKKFINLLYLHLIQPASGFFAVSADERNRSTFAQKMERAAYLSFRYAQKSGNHLVK